MFCTKQVKPNSAKSVVFIKKNWQKFAENKKKTKKFCQISVWQKKLKTWCVLYKTNETKFCQIGCFHQKNLAETLQKVKISKNRSRSLKYHVRRSTGAVRRSTRAVRRSTEAVRRSTGAARSSTEAVRSSTGAAWSRTGAVRSITDQYGSSMEQ